jgi:alanyl-tRNA synthetase
MLLLLLLLLLANVVKIVGREEELFLRTLDQGTKRLEKVLSKLAANEKGVKVLVRVVDVMSSCDKTREVALI